DTAAAAAAAQRPADATLVAAQPFSAVAAAPCAGAALPVPLHHPGRAAARSRVVASHADRRLRPAHDAADSGLRPPRLLLIGQRPGPGKLSARHDQVLRTD